MKLAVLIAVVDTALLVCSAGARAQARAAESVPDGLSATDWSSIRATYDANRHAAFPVDGGYQARNPGQQWRTRFDGRGLITAPDAGGWSWGLELVTYGREGIEQAVTTPASVEAKGGRVEYQWDASLTEWYLNDPRGLEHGYTVHQRPDGGAGALRFTLAVRGGLDPRLSVDGRSVTFVDTGGAAVVNYTGLTVFDASGAMLPAWFEVGDFNSPFSILHSQFVRIIVDDSDAIYPLTIDPVAQQAYLKASNTETFDGFGVSVAASGDTVVVGADGEDSSATGVNGNQADNGALGAGAAYVFVRDAVGVWTQQAYLKASNAGNGDQFGFSVAASGDTVVVGAIREDSNATGVNGNQANESASTSGAAYVFVRSGTSWSQQAYLKASNTNAIDFFGIFVAAFGDTVLVGAVGEDSNATGVNGNQADNSATDSGAAYVFVRSGTTWSQQAYLKASNTEASDQFGGVAASGDTVVVTAGTEDSNATGINGNQADNSATDSGAAYVFVRNVTTWSQQAYLKASNTDANDRFGGRMAVSGDTVVIGADAEDSSATGVNGNQSDNSASDAGAAYVFVRDSFGVWSQQAYLKASNTGAGDRFGISFGVSGDTLVVAAHLEDSSSTGIGGNQSNNSATDSGAAYLFVRSGTTWSQQAYLKAPNTGANDRFGNSVAVSGNTAVIGASAEDGGALGLNGDSCDNSAADSGAAYVFTGLGPPDLDGDSVPDETDNCALAANSDQTDADGDGLGDVCDVCPGTEAGLPVDSSGRPLRDCNTDCLYNADDIQCLVDEMLNP
ncbi:MAG TPA: FG-GAP repeat protein [Phycisphaerae bacterium]|nr:FG-GAP repeat protein [Phycisphaerae bacterium]